MMASACRPAYLVLMPTVVSQSQMTWLQTMMRVNKTMMMKDLSITSPVDDEQTTKQVDPLSGGLQRSSLGNISRDCHTSSCYNTTLSKILSTPSTPTPIQQKLTLSKALVGSFSIDVTDLFMVLY